MSFDVKLFHDYASTKYNDKLLKLESRSIPYSNWAAEMFQMQYEVRLKKGCIAFQISELTALGLKNHQAVLRVIFYNF